jgi:hypothetical protein
MSEGLSSRKVESQVKMTPRPGVSQRLLIAFTTF